MGSGADLRDMRGAYKWAVVYTREPAGNLFGRPEGWLVDSPRGRRVSIWIDTQFFSDGNSIGERQSALHEV